MSNIKNVRSLARLKDFSHSEVEEIFKIANDYHQITRELMDMAKHGSLLNPCPPFYRGEEVSKDVIESPYFIGYEFKKHLLEVQQAVIIYCLNLK